MRGTSSAGAGCLAAGGPRVFVLGGGNFGQRGIPGMEQIQGNVSRQGERRYLPAGWWRERRPRVGRCRARSEGDVPGKAWRLTLRRAGSLVGKEETSGGRELKPRV